MAVIALAYVFFSNGNGHEYKLLFQNGGQLVPDNEVLIGGSSVGSVESLSLTDDNLAEVKVSVDQELHEGTTAIIRATSLSGVANHYVSISPGPNSEPALENGATLGLGSTTTPVDIDQFFNTFPPSVRKGLSDFIKGNAQIYAGSGEEANEAFKYFGPALNRTDAFFGELTSDQRLFENFIVSSSKLSTTLAERGDDLSSAISNASTAFGAIAAQNRNFDLDLRRLPPVLRQSNTTFVNLRAALDDLEPLLQTAKPATRDLAPFLAELRPVISKLTPFMRDLRLTVRKPGKANDAGELLSYLPADQRLASRAFPHSEDAIADFLPNLAFARAYTPDIFNGFGKVGQVTGYYDGNGHYARVALAAQNVFNYNSASTELEPIPPSDQYDAFGTSSTGKRRCPGGATQPAGDGSSPFVNPPIDGGVSSSECNPNDVPPGP
ncbi:MAG TPA: MlaD family protein [Solirubrobacterales bacterium]|nr:MlaD family protein [Solirubrobacterales bacterium]